MNLDKIFIPIRKVDAENRLVYGVLAAETPDLANEIMDYEASKVAFQTWSDGVSKVTDGKSKGNLRAMHNNKVAGKFTQVECNDELKQIEVCAKIEADDEWKLVDSGSYTGFSIGAKAAWRKKDETDSSLTRYAVKTMIEGSLVDLPCIPTATFDYIKNGQSEIRKFQTNTSYVLNVPTDFKSTFKTVLPLLTKVGADDRNLAAFKTVEQSAGIKKSMWDVSDLACCLMTINRIRLNLTAEAQWENDSSPIPEALRTWIDEGSSLVAELLAEESSELTSDSPIDSMIQMSASSSEAKDIEKKVEPMSDKAEEIKKAAACACDCAQCKDGTCADCSNPDCTDSNCTGKKAAAADVTKSIDDAIAKRTQVFDEAVTKLNGQIEEQETVLKSLAESVKTIIDALKNMPAVSKGVVAVTKMQDAGVEEKEEPLDVRSAMLKALRPENGRRDAPVFSYSQVTK